MIRRKNILLVAILFLVVFVVTTNYLLYWLPRQSDVTITIEENIYLELKKLPIYYKINEAEIDDVGTLLKKINIVNITHAYNGIEKLWKLADTWPNKTQIVDIHSPQLGDILSLLSQAKIVKADLDHRGTQLKLLLTLEVI